MDGVARISRQRSKPVFFLDASPDIDDRELVLGDLGEGFVGVARPGDRVTGAGQDRRERGVTGSLGLEDEDGAGGQWVSGRIVADGKRAEDTSGTVGRRPSLSTRAC